MIDILLRNSSYLARDLGTDGHQNLFVGCWIWGTLDCEAICSELGEGLNMWLGPDGLPAPCLSISLALFVLVSDGTGSIELCI